MRVRRWHPLRLTVTVLVAGIAVVLVVWPQLFGLQRTFIVAQLVAFRAPLTLALCVSAVMFAAIAWGRRSWGVAAGLALVLGMGAIVSGTILLGRGVSSEAPTGGGELTVLAWNTQGGAVALADVASLVLEVDADVVSLPEMDEHTAEEVSRLVAARGHPMAAFTTYGATGYSEIPTSALVADELGDYEVDVAGGSTPGLPSVVLRPVDGDGPIIVAAHPFPPLPWRMDTWRAGLEWVNDRCESPDVIVTGDLNATIDHLWGISGRGGVVGSCRDAALSTGAASTGTWPATAPPWIAAPIDHILVGTAWTVRATHVVTTLDHAGSDHRPIVAVLDRR